MVSEGDIIVAQLPQADGSSKSRPVLALRSFPPFGDWLVCGISSQLHQAVEGFDVILQDDFAEFPDTGLRVSSVVRLSFLAIVPTDRMTRRLGSVSARILKTLQLNLANHLTATQ